MSDLIDWDRKRPRVVYAQIHRPVEFELQYTPLFEETGA
jgi:hypothetical protein